MDHIGDVIKSSVTGIGSKKSTKKLSDEEKALRKRLIELYGHFSSMYGAAWTSQQTEGAEEQIVNSKWLAVLEKLSGHQVKKALTDILFARTEFQKFAPHPQEFLALGRSYPFQEDMRMLQEARTREKPSIKSYYWIVYIHKLLGMPILSRETIRGWAVNDNLSITDEVIEEILNFNPEGELEL